MMTERKYDDGKEDCSESDSDDTEVDLKRISEVHVDPAKFVDHVRRARTNVSNGVGKVEGYQVSSTASKHQKVHRTWTSAPSCPCPPTGTLSREGELRQRNTDNGGLWSD